MRKIIFFVFLFMFIFAGVADAQKGKAKGKKDAGITPDSPLYVVDIATEAVEELLTLNPEAKVLKKVENAAERLAEMEAMQNKNNPKALEKAESNFEKK